MTDQRHHHTPARRASGLRTISKVTSWTVAGAVAVTGGLSIVAANAYSGTKKAATVDPANDVTDQAGTTGETTPTLTAPPSTSRMTTPTAPAVVAPAETLSPQTAPATSARRSTPRVNPPVQTRQRTPVAVSGGS